MSNRKGFTLIELLIILGGFGLVSLFLPAVQSGIEQNPQLECGTGPEGPSCVLEAGSGFSRPPSPGDF